jgi:hypothetical protein
VIPTAINAAHNVAQANFRIMGAPLYTPIRASERMQCVQDWLSTVKFCKCESAIQGME